MSQDTQTFKVYKYKTLEKTGSKDEGNLTLDFPSLTFIPKKKGKPSTSWKLEHLRGYGQEGDIFSFECGRLNPGGPGIHMLRVLPDKETSDVANISMLMDQAIRRSQGMTPEYSHIVSAPQQAEAGMYSTLVGATPRGGSVTSNVSVYSALNSSTRGASVRGANKEQVFYEAPGPRAQAPDPTYEMPTQGNVVPVYKYHNVRATKAPPHSLQQDSNYARLDSSTRTSSTSLSSSRSPPPSLNTQSGYENPVSIRRPSSSNTHSGYENLIPARR